jgi:ribosome-binding factor A
MTSRRTAKIASSIREIVSSTILFGLKDPRVKNVTVLGVEVGDDLRTAKVYISVMGEPRIQALTMHGLNSARGFIQSKVADQLQIRYTPVLTFVLDQGVKKSIAAAELLREALGDSPREESAELDDNQNLDPESSDSEDADPETEDLEDGNRER